jgi:hypothetical protein
MIRNFDDDVTLRRPLLRSLSAEFHLLPSLIEKKLLKTEKRLTFDAKLLKATKKKP